MNHYEHEQQCKVIEWKNKVVGHSLIRFPGLETLHSIPNGGARPKKRNPNTGAIYSPEAQRMVREGLKPGMPDLCLPVSRQGFLGLYIEMKDPNRPKPSQNQTTCHEQLREQGHRVEVRTSAGGAIKLISSYLSDLSNLFTLKAFCYELISNRQKEMERNQLLDSIESWFGLR
jgi:hypothetical protein